MKLYGFLGFYFVLISNLFGCCCKSKKEGGMSAGQGSKNSSFPDPKKDDKNIILQDRFANGLENIVNELPDDFEYLPNVAKDVYNNFIKGFGKLVGKILNNTAEGVKEEGLGEVNFNEFEGKSIDDLVECTTNSYKKINDVDDDLLHIFQKILGNNEEISNESISKMMENKDVICYFFSSFNLFGKIYVVFFGCKNDEYLEKIKKLRKINDKLFYVYVTTNNIVGVNLDTFKLNEVDTLKKFFNK